MPVLPPPPGVKSNFDHPKTNERPLRIVLITFSCFATVAVLIKIYTRKMISQQKWGWDDGAYFEPTYGGPGTNCC